MNPHQTNLEFYNRNAGRWAATKTDSFFHEEGFRKLRSLLNDGDEVIDIGCASGIHVPLFLGIGRNLRYAGFDISENMVRIAQSRYPQLQFHVVDIMDRAKLTTHRFAAFWAAAVLMHIPREEWDDLFANIKQITKLGGFGYFTLPTQRPSEETEADRRHFTLIGEDELEKFLENQGIRLIDKGGFTSPNKAIWRWYLVQLPN